MSFEATEPTLMMMKAYEKCIQNLSYVKYSPRNSTVELSDTEHIIFYLLSELNKSSNTETASNLGIVYTWMLDEITVLKTEPDDKKISHIILVMESLLEPLVTFFRKNEMISEIHVIEMRIDESLRNNNKLLFVELTNKLQKLYQTIL